MKTKILTLGFMLLSLFAYGQQMDEDERKDSMLLAAEIYPGYDPEELNDHVLKCVQEYGPRIAPTYQDANCTQFMIEVIKRFHPLQSYQKRQIAVTIPDNIDQILANLKKGVEKPEYRGVCHYLEFSTLGKAVKEWKDVRPGDFVQWWWFSGRQGQCGIIAEVNLQQKWFTVYSSTPSQGFGLKKYPISKDLYFCFARMTTELYPWYD